MPETLDPKVAELRDLLQRIQVSGSFESAVLAERISELGEEVIEQKRIRLTDPKANDGAEEPST